MLAIAALGVLLYAAAAHFASFSYEVFPSSHDYLLDAYRQAAYMTVYWVSDILAIVFILIAYRQLSADVRPDLGWRPSRPLWYVGALAMGVVLYFVNSAIVDTFRSFGIHGFSVFSEFRHPSVAVACLLLLQVGFVSPVLQEIVFRGWLFSGLRRAMPAAPAVIVSAAVFSLMHARSGLPTLTHAFLFGVVAAVVFERSRSIVPSAILHIAVNSISTLVFLTQTMNR